MTTGNALDILKKTVKTVLVCDESKSCRKIHAMLLSKLGLNVVEADGTDGEAVFHFVRDSLIEAARNKSAAFDIIMMANIMRGMTGPQTIKRIRQLGYKGLVIQVTSDTSDSDIAHFISCGANAVISKPFTIDKFLVGFEEGFQLGKTPKIKPTEQINRGNEKMPQEARLAEKTKIPDHIVKFRDSKFGDHSWRILIVDSSTTCRKINHRILAEMGHSVVEADCGNVATQMVQNALIAQSFGAIACSFDIVMMSNLMNGMSGPHTALRIREIGFDGIILGLMSNPQPKDLRHFLDNGADNVLAKPLTADEFSLAISDLCFPERYAKKVLAPVDVDNSQVEQKNAPESFPTEKKHLKIVVVDESTAIRRIHDRILSEAGHKVVTAASGAEGLSFIRKAHAEFAYGNHDAGYDVILISHMMTGMSGPNAIQKMRQQLQGKPCIILGVTGETSPADITEMKASGADAIISKPLDMRKFKRALRDVYAVYAKKSAEAAKARASMKMHGCMTGRSDTTGGSLTNRLDHPSNEAADESPPSSFGPPSKLRGPLQTQKSQARLMVAVDEFEEKQFEYEEESFGKMARSVASRKAEREPEPLLSNEEVYRALQEMTERRIMAGTGQYAKSVKHQLQNINKSSSKQHTANLRSNRSDRRTYSEADYTKLGGGANRGQGESQSQGQGQSQSSNVLAPLQLHGLEARRRMSLPDSSDFTAGGGWSQGGGGGGGGSLYGKPRPSWEKFDLNAVKPLVKNVKVQFPHYESKKQEQPSENDTFLNAPSLHILQDSNSEQQDIEAKSQLFGYLGKPYSIPDLSSGPRFSQQVSIDTTLLHRDLQEQQQQSQLRSTGTGAAAGAIGGSFPAISPRSAKMMLGGQFEGV